MTRFYRLKGYYTIKAENKIYPWPDVYNPVRKVELKNDDILSKSEDGTIILHGRHGGFGMLVPDEDLIYHHEEIILERNFSLKKYTPSRKLLMKDR